MGYLNIVEKLVTSYKINLHEGLSFSDLPFFEKYVAEIKFNKISDFGIGISIKNKIIAKERAVFESIERECLFYNKRDRQNFIKSSIKELDKKNIKHIDINNGLYFSKYQIKNNPRQLKISRVNKFYWTSSIEFHTKEKVLIPSQLIYLNAGNNEKVIQQPISTGGAGGINQNDAILRGIFEVIERDAFMIHYLAKTYGELIDYSMNKRLMKIKKYLKQYNLEWYLVSLPTDLNIYTILSFIIDKTKLGVPLSCGMKTGLNPYKVTIGAIEESYMGLTFSRKNLVDKDLNKVDEKNIFTMKQRDLYWTNKGKLKYINSWIKNKRKIKFDEMKNLSQNNINKDLNFVSNILKSKNHNIYYVDIQKEDFKKYGEFEIVKVIIPSLQPLYLNEKYKCLGGNRIYDIPVKLGYYRKPLKEEELNQIPHFFL